MPSPTPPSAPTLTLRTDRSLIRAGLRARGT